MLNLDPSLRLWDFVKDLYIISAVPTREILCGNIGLHICGVNPILLGTILLEIRSKSHKVVPYRSVFQHWPHEARGELLYQVRGWKLNVALQHRELCDTREAWIIFVARCSQRRKSHGDKTTPIGTCLSFFFFDRYTWEGAKNWFFSFIPRRSPTPLLARSPTTRPDTIASPAPAFWDESIPPKSMPTFPPNKISRQRCLMLVCSLLHLAGEQGGRHSKAYSTYLCLTCPYT